MTDETLTRASVPEMDEILGRQFPVLDDGFVRVVDYMGNDAAVAQAARISYGAGTKSFREDRGLLRYLMRKWHTSPFEQVEIKLHVRVPMDAWRQWIRHRTASVNEYSTRYSEAIDAAQTTDPEKWRFQSKRNKQGSDEFLPVEVGRVLSAREKTFQADARDMYEERIEHGVAREQARKDLPLSTYTEAYWKVDGHNLMHFLRLRMDEHAQWEIRAFANVIGEEILARWMPVTWEAFEDFRLHAWTLTAIEVGILGAILRGEHDEACRMAEDVGWFAKPKVGERNEFEEKLVSLGTQAPWAE